MVRLRPVRQLPKAARRTLARYRGKPCATAADAGRLWKSFSKLKAYQVLREALRRTSGGRCAYCEKREPGTVDHFRPKHYGRRVFALANLLPCCGVCQGHKLDHFPVAGPKALLLNPYAPADDPVLFLGYDDLGAAVPRGPGLTGMRPKATIDTLRLDKRWELGQTRRETWERLLSCCVDYNQEPSPEAAEDMVFVLTSISSHRGVVRFMLEEVGQVRDAVEHATQHYSEVRSALSRPPYTWR
ncbi:MAG: hypothetical protein FJX75_09315 [Armatimonadetes bacterium]|nr:hypothetical protein [Armatimonadota bacterium]